MQCTGIAALLLIILIHWSAATFQHKVCSGTNVGMSKPFDMDDHYQNLRDKYINCTFVDGNLEITWLRDEKFDLGFLKDIREVSGYVLIAHVNIRRIVLPKLMIIRGLLNMHAQEELALLVTRNTMEILGLPELRDILFGGVGFFDNRNLCYVNTIKWEEIIKYSFMIPMTLQNFAAPESCPPCHRSCLHGCWGPDPLSCQKFSKMNCAPRCHGRSCFGPNQQQCCHSLCAGGCTGPTQRDCLACRIVNDSGVCKIECPRVRRFNPDKNSFEHNPDGKYVYGATCVKDCPEGLLRDAGACVKSCPDTKRVMDGECVFCNGPCPKSCPGVDIVHSGNIANFKGCRIVEGSLTILDTSFEGFQVTNPNSTFGPRFSSMHPTELEIFSTLIEVTGFLNIQANHSDFKNLSFFRNLEIIRGLQLTEMNSSLYIVKTSLESLNLRSLREVLSGTVAIAQNPKLCFASEMEWTHFLKSRTGSAYLEKNAGRDYCREQGLVCHEECSRDGCWGPGPEECLSCKAYSFNNTCLANCSETPGVYDAGNQICEPCDLECSGECLGPGPGNCTLCLNVRNGPYCVNRCPANSYIENGECRSCHDNCVKGCTGPKSFLGLGGCNMCKKEIETSKNVMECFKANDPCPVGFFEEHGGYHLDELTKSLSEKMVCRKCHSRCTKCTAYRVHMSACDCRSYSLGDMCEDTCPRDYYADNSTLKCLRCAADCRGCHGPSSRECDGCRFYRLFLTSNRTLFNCTDSCPTDTPYVAYDHFVGYTYCSDVDPKSSPMSTRDKAVLGGGLAAMAVLAVSFFLILYFWVEKSQKPVPKQPVSKSRMKGLIMELTKMDEEEQEIEEEPIKPSSNVKPNLGKLIIVKEAELKICGTLARGAFGVIYKGVWIPEEGHGVVIPASIKIYRDKTCNKYILQESYMMASIEHPNCLKLLAICMATQFMIISQLMPLGCLLDYVRINKDNIGSRSFMTWCSQIAKGMAYLETSNVIFRNLALRNILLKTPECIQLSDFRLAKFIDLEHEEYKGTDGKVAIRWLALECLQRGSFSNKSDVWSFGVTIWELLTYGGQPYENTPAGKVQELLESGERLPQPSISNTGLYNLMTNCWLPDAKSRPTLEKLDEEFAMMALHPDRHLAIEGDEFKELPAFSPRDVNDYIRVVGASSGRNAGRVKLDDGEYFTFGIGQNPKPEADSVEESKTEYANPPTQLKPRKKFKRRSVPPIPVQSDSPDYCNEDADPDKPPPVPRRLPKPRNVDENDSTKA